VSTYETWNIVIGSLTTAIAGFGLFGLWRYVKHTKAIAEATKLQGDILSKPTISVFCSPLKEAPRKKYARVNTRIVNHSMVHAKIKVVIKAKLRVNGADHDKEFLAPEPYNGMVWLFSAKQEFHGHFSFKELECKEITNKDTLTLEVISESSAHGARDNFEKNPSILYNWKHSTEDWIPAIPPQSHNIN